MADDLAHGKVDLGALELAPRLVRECSHRPVSVGDQLADHVLSRLVLAQAQVDQRVRLGGR